MFDATYVPIPDSDRLDRVLDAEMDRRTEAWWLRQGLRIVLERAERWQREFPGRPEAALQNILDVAQLHLEEAKDSRR